MTQALRVYDRNERVIHLSERSITAIGSSRSPMCCVWSSCRIC